MAKTCGARDRTRTGKALRPADFKSAVATNFTTLACRSFYRRQAPAPTQAAQGPNSSPLSRICVSSAAAIGREYR